MGAMGRGRDTHQNRRRDRHALAAIALLADEVRGRLYRFVRAQPTPVTRDQAATAIGISRKLAAFHLDKLTAAGLLEATTPDPAAGPTAPRCRRPEHPAADRGQAPAAQVPRQLGLARLGRELAWTIAAKLL